MAKKSAKTKRASKSTKKSARKVSKKKPMKSEKGPSSKRAMARPRSTSAASAAKSTTMRAAAAGKHKYSRIGLTRSLHIEADGVTPNVFTVYGDSIGATNPNTPAHPNHKHVKKPKAKHHKFEFVGDPGWVDAGDDAIEITATCLPSFTARKKSSFGSDDLTVTIILDEGTTVQDTTECTFDDVDYNP